MITPDTFGRFAREVSFDADLRGIAPGFDRRTVRGMTTNFDDRQPSLTDLASMIEAAADPAARLAAIAALEAKCSDLTHVSVAEARATGSTWTTIGAALAISKQAAAQRFTPKPERASEGEAAATNGPARTPSTKARGPHLAVEVAGLTVARVFKRKG